MKAKKLPLFQQPEAKRVLSESCKRHNVSLSLLQALIDVQRDYMGSGRREGITSDLDTVFADYVELDEDR